jgi:hypothetical protein
LYFRLAIGNFRGDVEWKAEHGSLSFLQLPSVKCPNCGEVESFDGSHSISLSDADRKLIRDCDTVVAHSEFEALVDSVFPRDYAKPVRPGDRIGPVRWNIEASLDESFFFPMSSIAVVSHKIVDLVFHQSDALLFQKVVVETKLGEHSAQFYDLRPRKHVGQRDWTECHLCDSRFIQQYLPVTGFSYDEVSDPSVNPVLFIEGIPGLVVNKELRDSIEALTSPSRVDFELIENIELQELEEFGYVWFDREETNGSGAKN